MTNQWRTVNVQYVTFPPSHSENTDTLLQWERELDKEEKEVDERKEREGQSLSAREGNREIGADWLSGCTSSLANSKAGSGRGLNPVLIPARAASHVSALHAERRKRIQTFTLGRNSLHAGLLFLVFISVSHRTPLSLSFYKGLHFLLHFSLPTIVEQDDSRTASGLLLHWAEGWSGQKGESHLLAYETQRGCPAGHVTSNTPSEVFFFLWVGWDWWDARCLTYLFLQMLRLRLRDGDVEQTGSRAYVGSDT